MRRFISIILVLGFLGYIVGSFVVATSQGSSPTGCWRMYKHDVDDHVWDNGEWYWAGGVRGGYVRICDGRATIEVNTVEHVAAVSTDKGTRIIRGGPYEEQTSRIAYTTFEYQRANGGKLDGRMQLSMQPLHQPPQPIPVKTHEKIKTISAFSSFYFSIAGSRSRRHPAVA